jgi:hypothetical protein
MKILSVLAMTAALVATGASAQGVSGHSDLRHSTKAQERIAGSPGSSSFASARPRASRPQDPGLHHPPSTAIGAFSS